MILLFFIAKTQTQPSAREQIDEEVVDTEEVSSTQSNVVETQPMDVSASSSVQTQTNVIVSADEEKPTSSRSLQTEPILTEMQISDQTSQIELDEPIDLPMFTPAFHDDENCPEFDVGKWLGKVSEMTTAQKSDLLYRRWKPTEGYDFRADAENPQRRFIHNWLQTYAPWLSYSKKLKGALCIYCVLFPPTVFQGVLGAFAIKPFTKYKDMHETCQKHESSHYHRTSTQAAKDFMESTPVDVMMITGHEMQIETNRQIISSIINTIIFCGSHDMALRGKENRGGNIFRYLQIFCINYSVFSMCIYGLQGISTI